MYGVIRKTQLTKCTPYSDTVSYTGKGSTKCCAKSVGKLNYRPCILGTGRIHNNATNEILILFGNLLLSNFRYH